MYHPPMSRSPGILAALILSSWAALARADLPPPEGKKFVSYGFVVENVKAFPDYVLLAYPWSSSNGAPTKEHALVEDGKAVRLGRRSAAPKLYAMQRGEYEKWKTSYKPTHELDDPALDALFTSKQVVPCGVELSPKTQLDKGDPRDEVIDALRVESIDTGACRVALAKSAAAAKQTPSPAETPPTPAERATPLEPATPAAANPEPNPRGCGACEAMPGAGRGFFGFSALALCALVWRRRCAR